MMRHSRGSFKALWNEIVGALLGFKVTHATNQHGLEGHQS